MRIWTLFCLIALCACARPPRSTVPTDPGRSEESEAPAQEQAAEDRTRYSLEQEGEADAADVEFEEDRLEAPEDSAGEGFEIESPRARDEKPEPIAPSQSIPVAPSDPNAEPAYRIVRGFRVQLAALTDPAEAENERSLAASRLGVAVYVHVETPLYKIRAGDYLDRGEAVALQTRARSLGYPEAWVVSTEVRISAP